MYSDKQPGRPCYGFPEPDLTICYMTLSVDKSGGAESGEYATAVNAGAADWNDERTAIFFAQVPFDGVNDVHFKTADTAGLGDERAAAITRLYNYHQNYCSAGDCNDPDGNAAHQPQRWWYAYVYLDAGGAVNRFLSLTPAQRATTVAHELGHALGLDDYWDYFDYDNNGVVQEPRPCSSSYPTIMNFNCGFLEHPLDLDECMVNHAYFFPPLMYGDSVDSNMNSYAYVGCP